MYKCANGHTVKLPIIVGVFKPIVCWACVVAKDGK